MALDRPRIKQSDCEFQSSCTILHNFLLWYMQVTLKLEDNTITCQYSTTSTELLFSFSHRTFTGDVCVLENAAEFYRTVEIKIKECKGKINVQI